MIERPGPTELLPVTAARRAHETTINAGETTLRPDTRDSIDALPNVAPNVAMVRSAIFRILTKDNPAYESAKH